ncbi:MAG: molybdate ABC transporter substrate-binding protein [Enterobacterales bacterium]|nr:molybdate ABC transporter substrate-binding protein [Enterobacterales bacterium]
MKRLILVFIIALSSFTLRVYAEQTTIVVASNFIRPMKDLIDHFHQSSPHKIKVSYGSSGKIYAQIINGAPFDLFFSADSDKPTRLLKRNLVFNNSIYCYAVGQLVLWSKQNNKANLLQQLKSNHFNKLALANPKLAPYGQAAFEVMQQLKLVELSQRKWVLAENVGQSFQFVMSGNAQLGFIALSQVTQNNQITQGSIWLVPSEFYQPVRQEVVLLKHAANNEAAKAFYLFIKSDSAKHIMSQYGYQF